MPFNIQKDANERKLTQAGGTNAAIYMCTNLRYVLCMKIPTILYSWQILYVNHVLWYVNGNADNQNLLTAVKHWVERTDFDEVGSLVLFNWNMPKSRTGFSHALLETAFTLYCGNTAWPLQLFQLLVIIASNFTCPKFYQMIFTRGMQRIHRPRWNHHGILKFNPSHSKPLPFFLSSDTVFGQFWPW